MNFLVTDIGYGTQEVMFWSDDVHPDNNMKMVLPSPSQYLAREILFLQKKVDLVLYGEIMGSQPLFDALKKHVHKGNNVYCTEEAAKSFFPDVKMVEKVGINIIKESEINDFPSALKFHMSDLMHYTLLKQMGNKFDIIWDKVGFALQDHGSSKIEEGDSRFEVFMKKLQEYEGDVTEFIYELGEVPRELPRMKSLESQLLILREDGIILDSLLAMILGASMDPRVTDSSTVGLINAGNGHLFVSIFQGNNVLVVLEHHTNLVREGELQRMIKEYLAGKLSSSDIISSGGHGAITITSVDFNDVDIWFLQGPKRFKYYIPWAKLAIPFGDQSMIGPAGLIKCMRYILTPILKDKKVKL